MSLDIDRMSDWLHAVQQWQRGDARAVAAFVLRYGAQTDDERRAVADMLMSKPDARRGAKAATEAVLRDVDRMIERRQRDIGNIRLWAQRLRRRLAARGMTRAQIEALLKRHRPGYLQPRGLTDDDIFHAAAALHGMTGDAVTKAHKRNRSR